MARHITPLALTALTLITLIPAILIAQQPAAFKPPQDLTFRKATIMSEGSRLAGELFSLKSLDGQKLPTIIMSHGWGGTAALLRTDAVAFARAGYLVVTFDYRGWGASESRVILAQPAPVEKENHRFTAEVIEVREVVDPLDQANDLQNVIHWVQGEPQCDTDRIGLWGSSFSGGNVVYAAERDPRVKALVSQVPPQQQLWVVAGKGWSQGENPRATSTPLRQGSASEHDSSQANHEAGVVRGRMEKNSLRNRRGGRCYQRADSDTGSVPGSVQMGNAGSRSRIHRRNQTLSSRRDNVPNSAHKL